ncbi:MAG: hypothetical protein IT376_00660 [Polyangiaceae bacterium]|nr:hypothetical protein [Polyangiaceae bacterium]
MSTARVAGSGPFRADQLNSPSSYELSVGHARSCQPKASRGGASAVAGAVALRTDPAGIEAGYRLGEETLRAPAIWTVNVPAARSGWAEGAPPLAVEYADTGQDDADLEVTVQELLAAGARYPWVVRRTGPRRVEVHEPGKPMRVVDADGELTAPGVLQNAAPAAALYDRSARLDVALRSLLPRRGYPDLEAVRAERRHDGELNGRAQPPLTVLAARGLPLSAAQRARILACADPATLDRRLAGATTSASVRDVLGEQHLVGARQRRRGGVGGARPCASVQAPVAAPVTAAPDRPRRAR